MDYPKKFGFFKIGISESIQEEVISRSSQSTYIEPWELVSYLFGKKHGSYDFFTELKTDYTMYPVIEDIIYRTSMHGIILFEYDKYHPIEKYVARSYFLRHNPKIFESAIQDIPIVVTSTSKRETHVRFFEKVAKEYGYIVVSSN